MRIAFLEPLERSAKEMPEQYLPEHELLVAPADGELPQGIQRAEVVVWSRWPVDRAFIERLPYLRFMQRLGRFRARGDASVAVERGVPVSVLPHGTVRPSRGTRLCPHARPVPPPARRPLCRARWAEPRRARTRAR